MAQSKRRELKVLESVSQTYSEKQAYCEALGRVDLAQSINSDRDNYSLIVLKGILLKLLDLPSKSTQYLKEALLLATNNKRKLQVCLELTDVYAVNGRYESAGRFLEQVESLLGEKEPAAT